MIGLENRVVVLDISPIGCCSIEWWPAQPDDAS
jgi:hypothetical protein